MADQNFMDLASKTASGITGTDYMMLVNNSEAYKALVNDVAEAILSKLTSKSFSGLETTAKNVIGALNELNSKTTLVVGSIQEIMSKAGALLNSRTYPIFLLSSCVNEIVSQNTSGKGFITVHSSTMYDLFFLVGAGPTVTQYFVRINNGAISENSLCSITMNAVN